MTLAHIIIIIILLLLLLLFVLWLPQIISKYHLMLCSWQSTKDTKNWIQLHINVIFHYSYICIILRYGIQSIEADMCNNKWTISFFLNWSHPFVFAFPCPSLIIPLFLCPARHRFPFFLWSAKIFFVPMYALSGWILMYTAVLPTLFIFKIMPRR